MLPWARDQFSVNAEKETNVVRKVITVIGSVLLIGGVGYSEMPAGNFGVGITEAFVGLGIVLYLVHSS